MQCVVYLAKFVIIKRCIVGSKAIVWSVVISHKVLR